MSQTVEFDLKHVVLANDSFGPREVRQMQEAIARDFSQYAILRDAVGELQSREDHTPASRVRLGVCLYLLGRYYRAIEMLKQADGGAMAHYYLAKSHFARQEYAAAIESYKEAAKAGYDAGDCALGRAEAQRYDNDARAALATLDSLSGAIEQTAEYLAQRAATVAVLGGNPQEVVALYERAVEADRNHAGALFGLALENDRRGNDDTAMELYKRAADRFPAHVGSLLNLGLLHEDRDQYEKAAQCYQRVLDVYPDHARAALFFKDTEASHEQYYDDDAAEEARPDEPGARHSGDRFRAFGPQPQLSAKDGHHDPGRPLPLHRAGAVGQQELRRDQPGRDQGDVGHEGLAVGPVRPGAAGRRSIRARGAVRPTSRRC